MTTIGVVVAYLVVVFGVYAVTMWIDRRFFTEE